MQAVDQIMYPKNKTAQAKYARPHVHGIDTDRLRSMVFRRAAWGAPLWNAFFQRCVAAPDAREFNVVIRADDCDLSGSSSCLVPKGKIFEDIVEP